VAKKWKAAREGAWHSGGGAPFGEMMMSPTDLPPGTDSVCPIGDKKSNCGSQLTAAIPTGEAKG